MADTLPPNDWAVRAAREAGSASDVSEQLERMHQDDAATYQATANLWARNARAVDAVRTSGTDAMSSIRGWPYR